MSDEDTELPQEVWDARCDVLYKSWVQLRYHQKKRRWWDVCDKLTKSLTVLLGASLLGRWMQDHLPLAASAISCLGLLALVLGYTDRKQSHKEIAESAANLIASVEQVPAGELTPAKVASWKADFARMCAKSPPPQKWLTLICEREQSSADGHPDHVRELRFFQRWLAHFY